MVIAFAQNSNAQSGVGGGASYFIHTGGSDFGANARGNFALGDNMEIAPGFTYYFVSNVTQIAIDGDFHYLFGDEGSFRFYPLAGIELLRLSVTGASQSEIQINVGGGIKLPLGDSMSFITESKYVIGDGDGLVLTAGVIFHIGG